MPRRTAAPTTPYRRTLRDAPKSARTYKMTIDRYGNGEQLGLQILPIGTFSDDQQIHIAPGGRNAGGKGAKKVYGLNILRLKPFDGFRSSLMTRSQMRKRLAAKVKNGFCVFDGLVCVFIGIILFRVSRIKAVGISSGDIMFVKPHCRPDQ